VGIGGQPEPAPELVLDQDALLAAVDVINRMGAIDFEVGHLDDTPRSEDARWWARARWNGTKVAVEDHTGPDTAAEALAKRLMNGGQCTHCAGTITLGPTSRAQRRAGKLCAWTRQGVRWVRGCADRVPEGQRAVPTPARRGELPRRHPR
jgi:hypothetical protein